MDAGTRPHVHTVIGGTDHVFVMLDHQDGVAQVAQMLQGVDQSIVVALVQANAGLVQHIHHTCQPRTNLRGQANPLGFAA